MFLNSGHSISMTWALYALSQNKQAQSKLRREVSDLSTNNPTMDDLNGLPYLDAVVRETMRRYSPLSVVARAADKDDFIRLSKPFTDRKGNVQHEIRFAFVSNLMSLSNLNFYLCGIGSERVKRYSYLLSSST